MKRVAAYIAAARKHADAFSEASQPFFAEISCIETAFRWNIAPKKRSSTMPKVL
jgi:hypothetical protein